MFQIRIIWEDGLGPQKGRKTKGEGRLLIDTIEEKNLFLYSWIQKLVSEDLRIGFCVKKYFRVQLRLLISPCPSHKNTKNGSLYLMFKNENKKVWLILRFQHPKVFLLSFILSRTCMCTQDYLQEHLAIIDQIDETCTGPTGLRFIFMATKSRLG